MSLREKHPLRTLPTHYHSIRFRNRLEAKWALFFELSKIEWAYRPDAFDFDGVWYQPGFRIVVDGNALWAEVKSKFHSASASFSDFEQAKTFEQAENFAECGERIVLLAGQPEAKPYRLLFGKDERFGARFVDFSDDHLRHSLAYTPEHDGDLRWWLYLLGGACGPNGDRDPACGAADVSTSPRYCDAVAAVRNARFRRDGDCEILCA